MLLNKFKSYLKLFIKCFRLTENLFNLQVDIGWFRYVLSFNIGKHE